MADTQRLAYSIIQFLHDQLNSGGLSSDAQESLEVAVQCLETAFGVSIDDSNLAVSETLPELFAAATLKQAPRVTVSAMLDSPTEEEAAEAERFKTEGNEQMKVENFGQAVDFYSKAIELNPCNAVYFCNRAAAYSKLGNYAGAVQDCERAISIDPNYSKAFGRMGLALASLNKHTEAVNYYKKALELDPDNNTYKSNLKIAEQKMRELPSPTGGVGGVDLAGLLSNPGFMNMASSLMTNPQVQQLMSGMMSGSYGPVGATGAGAGAGQGVGVGVGRGGAGPVGTGPNDLSGLIQAGQQFAQQMQQENPDLIEQLRIHIRSRLPSTSNEEQP
ncbi:small glutamine-rich tetratricopeptide repeat-containing protein alpha-like isoform X1 [Polyodon spathula]|uniref:small glutamine-rich tetratricopeptide repeat-containing protein alpha-like isoform X1 n=1 Tax=Polyodon spathula TaxID=7913 RepID=UPI001B7EF834|nr:small glutamine-rich tetratricopeptide repeat-containing protein alpha-like isoform X1 [Polyodon spathula]XP_041086716.1 small glutamine-rich tetratricopeptide repeat-containing protein alpha-like isoform X1 [Polyodon spathula]